MSNAPRASNPGLLPLLTGLLAAAVFLAPVAARQDSQPPSSSSAVPQPTFRTGVSLVRVDVTVTGPNDEPVPDLRPEDFEVREDDVPQDIETFQFVRLSGEPGPGDDTVLDIRSRAHGEAEAARDDVRVFALFLDDYHVSDDIGINMRIRDALIEWVQTLKPTDIVVPMEPLMPISSLEYTRDRQKVIDIIKKFKGRRGVYTPPRSIMEDAQNQSQNPPRVRAEVTLTALTAIVTHLGALRERRTSVIFVSSGPPLIFADGTLELVMAELLEAANRFNVTINVVDPRGLQMSAASGTLWRMAGDTGGRAIVNTNGLADGLQQVTQDASAYYLLGYNPSHPPDGKFHEIDVRLKRRGLRLLARKGYWSASEQEMSPPTVELPPPGVQNALGVLSQLEGNRKALVWTGFEPSGDERTKVRVSWQPTPQSDGGRPTLLRVSAQSGDTTVLDEQGIPLTGDAGGGIQPAGRSFTLTPGAVRLSLTLEDEAGNIVDRWSEDLTVPVFDAERLALGTPMVLRARSPLEYRAIVNDPAESIPTPAREFRRTDRVVLRTGLAGAAGDIPRVHATLLNRAGKELVKFPLTVGGEGIVRFELPLANLAVGDYVLELQAQNSRVTTTQHVAFRMIP